MRSFVRGALARTGRRVTARRRTFLFVVALYAVWIALYCMNILFTLGRPSSTSLEPRQDVMGSAHCADSSNRETSVPVASIALNLLPPKLHDYANRIEWSNPFQVFRAYARAPHLFGSLRREMDQGDVPRQTELPPLIVRVPPELLRDATPMGLFLLFLLLVPGHRPSERGSVIFVRSDAGEMVGEDGSWCFRQLGDHRVQSNDRWVSIELGKSREGRRDDVQIRAFKSTRNSNAFSSRWASLTPENRSLAKVPECRCGQPDRADYDPHYGTTRDEWFKSPGECGFLRAGIDWACGLSPYPQPQRSRVLLLYQRDHDRRFVDPERTAQMLTASLGDGWKVKQMVHDETRPVCDVVRAVRESDVLLLAHGFSAMLGLFLRRGAHLVELFPYKYWKHPSLLGRFPDAEGYQSMAQPFGLDYMALNSTSVGWWKSLILRAIPFESCMQSKRCRKWARTQDVVLSESHVAALTARVKRDHVGMDSSKHSNSNVTARKKTKLVGFTKPGTEGAS